MWSQLKSCWAHCIFIRSVCHHKYILRSFAFTMIQLVSADSQNLMEVKDRLSNWQFQEKDSEWFTGSKVFLWFVIKSPKLRRNLYMYMRSLQRVTFSNCLCYFVVGVSGGSLWRNCHGWSVVDVQVSASPCFGRFWFQGLFRPQTHARRLEWSWGTHQLQVRFKQTLRQGTLNNVHLQTVL